MALKNQIVGVDKTSKCWNTEDRDSVFCILSVCVFWLSQCVSIPMAMSFDGGFIWTGMYWAKTQGTFVSRDIITSSLMRWKWMWMSKSVHQYCIKFKWLQESKAFLWQCEQSWTINLSNLWHIETTPAPINSDLNHTHSPRSVNVIATCCVWVFKL